MQKNPFANRRTGPESSQARPNTSSTGPTGQGGIRRESGVHQRVVPPAQQEEAQHPHTRSRQKWSLVEQFEHEGHLYRLVRRPLDSLSNHGLTKREEQAVSVASTGKSRAEIAHELGVSPSTVGVMLHRASAKFGVKSRKDLLERYREEQAAKGVSKDGDVSSGSGEGAANKTTSPAAVPKK